MRKGDALARKGCRRIDLLDHVQELARGVVLGRMQMKTVSAGGEELQHAAKFFFRFCRDRDPFGIGQHIAVADAADQRFAETGKAKHLALRQLAHLGRRRLQLRQLIAAIVGRDEIVHAQRQFSGAHHVCEDSALRESDARGVQVADGSQPEPVELAKAVTQAPAHPIETRTGNLVVDKFPCRHALEPAAQLAVGIALEFTAGRIGALAVDANYFKRGAVEQRALTQILHVNRMIWRDGV